MTPNHPIFNIIFYISVTSEVRHFKFDGYRRFTIECHDLSVTNRPWKGRGQGHLAKIKILHALKYLWNGWS